MKFSCLQQDLLPPLQQVGRSVGVHSALPVLDNILLSCEGKKLRLAATNLEVGVIKWVPVEVEIEGELTIPAKTFIELISSLGQSKITFESEGEILTVESGKAKVTINGIAASEFPAIPLPDGKGFSFPKHIFLACSQILFATAVDEGRPQLTGVLTKAEGQKLEFVATDGFRLAHLIVPLDKEGAPFKSLIPKRTFEEILRIIAEDSEDQLTISPSQNQNQIVFTIGPTTLSSRLIEGVFPSWEKIIPQKTNTRLILEREEFLKALKLAAIFSASENVVSLELGKDKFQLSSSAKQLGTQENELEAQVEGEQLKIAFNTKFLLDVVSAASSKQLMVEFSGPLSPALIKPVGIEGLEYILMPVRLT
ncbi:DNA polymerase III subunit beta [Candidatus Daviesbacteria bacterium]|nr:DNA polymerase III subunit beta [Candidatus Daviesbacteria bacterium]